MRAAGASLREREAVVFAQKLDEAKEAKQREDVPKGGTIPIKFMQTPLFELAPEDREGIPLMSDLGPVDVGPLAKHLSSFGEGVWQPENQEGNVVLSRPGHDRWGVGKIVLIFCDDYMRRHFYLPWWKKWKRVVEPIFAQLKIPTGRVVRCLLAMMPPGAVIPPHHDTGFWVPRTHRVHVPILTHDEIRFEVGATEEDMHWFELPVGRAQELNNCSKHCVTNAGQQNRVHMIFDWIEDPALAPQRVLHVKPGDALMQTRRSIDLRSERGKRPFPSFLVLGAQKAGTTSMYAYLMQHHLILPAKYKETHYLDWRWQGEADDPTKAEARVEAMGGGDTLEPWELDMDEKQKHWQHYSAMFNGRSLRAYPSLMTGEATPSYLIGGWRTIARVKALASHAQFIIMLREPVERAFSQYIMTTDPVGSPAQLRNRGKAGLEGKTFEEVVETELAELEALGITAQSSCADFERYVRGRPEGQGGHSFLARGFYALQLQQWLRHFAKDRFHFVHLPDLFNPVQGQATMNGVFRFLGLPNHSIPDFSPKNARAREVTKGEEAKEGEARKQKTYRGGIQLSQSTKERLEAVFAPHNRALFELLGTDLGWAT